MFAGFHFTNDPKLRKSQKLVISKISDNTVLYRCMCICQKMAGYNNIELLGNITAIVMFLCEFVAIKIAFLMHFAVDILDFVECSQWPSRVLPDVFLFDFCP